MDAGPTRRDGLKRSAMLRRLLLLLLLTGLSLPAMAMTGHCAMAASVPMAQGHHHEGHGKPAPAKTSAASDCIGCLTPPVDSRPRFRSPTPAPARHALTNDASLVPGALEPATPPPRA